MKKSFKKASAIVLTMALMINSSVSVFAAKTTSSRYSGQIYSADLRINMDLPSNSSLTVKPYAKKQVLTAPMYFHNYNEASTVSGDDKISYMVGLAGYTCVATSASSTDPVKVAAKLPTGKTTKTITANIELGEIQQNELMDNEEFQSAFVAVKSLAVTRLSKTSYDGSAGSAYTKNADTTQIKVEPGMYLPYRITGSVNKSAKWASKDKIVIVPVFSIGIVIETVQ